MKDYLVVGLGLAGLAFCEQLIRHGKTFVVYEDDSQQSSQVAGGLYNPVILKRFTPAWDAQRQIAGIPFYERLEEKLQKTFDYKVPVFRRFISVEEQNNWYDASDKPILEEFLAPEISKHQFDHVESHYGYGEVKQTGRVDTRTLLNAYRSYLQQNFDYSKRSVDYQSLIHTDTSVECEGTHYQQLVFCEGFGLKNNPFFNYLPLKGTKGELLTIKAPDLKLDNVIKSSVFIIPLGNDLYRIGATYKWKDKTNTPTQEAKEELLTKLRTFLRCDFEVVNHQAGVRPTVTDRRPLVGQHPELKRFYVLNGMGSRGVMIAPTMAKELYDYIENNSPLSEEVDIGRFKKKYFVNSFPFQGKGGTDQSVGNGTGE